MSKKMIIISFITIILSSGIVVVLLSILQNPKVAPAPIEKIKYSADGSRDYGACTLLNKEFIKTTIGETASNLQGPDAIGLASLSNNDKVQVCSYSFIDGGTLENKFNSHNGFTLEVYLHNNQASKVAFKAIRDESAKSVNSIGEGASYKASHLTDGSISYALTVYSALRHYTYTINQPSDLKQFTDETAETKLTAIAKSIEY
jgi:hypothetical protein